MKERIILFTAHSKLIIRCLPFLLSIVFLFVPALNVDAADFVPDFVGSVYSPTFSKEFSSPLDGMSVIGSEQGTTAVLTDYLFSEHVSGTISYNFYNNNTITPFDSNAINYQINVNLGLNDNYRKAIKNVSLKCYLLIAGQEYPITINANDWLIVPTTFPRATHFTLVCEYDFDYYREFHDYRSDYTYGTLDFRDDFTVNMGLISWNVYNQPDTVSVMSENVKSLLAEIPVIEGAIREETQNQTDTLTNGYESSNMGEAENKFNSSAGDLTSIEDTLSGSSSQMVDTFTSTGFDASLLESVAPSMQYIVTWFTNFWNIGGALTKCFTLCFALFIAFYILRVRS